MAGAPSIAWKSRISWRITLTVFATILLIQVVVLSFTVKNFQNEKLFELREISRTAVSSALLDTRDQMKSPLTEESAQRLIVQTIIEGMAVYALDHSLLHIYGIPTILAPSNDAGMPREHRSTDTKYYEVIFTPSDLFRPYYVVTRMNASIVEPYVIGHVKESLLILLFMSAFVTTVLMIVLGQWLLEPMMLLRNNLLSAAKNPEKPDILRMNKETRDEVGIAIRIANDLIRQNAHNLKRLRAQAEDKIHKLAYYDTLTGLPNRTFFLEKLEDQIKQNVVGEDGPIAVLSVDLDHFKDVNDTMGHEYGDKLLEAIGRRLVKALPPDAVVARASADEFTIMVNLKPERPDSALLVDDIFTAIAEPVSVLQERFQVRVSIGVAHYPTDGSEARQIMKNADIALNRAKEEGRDTVRYYSQDFDRVVQQRFQLLRDLRGAMDSKQLQLHYHPQFDLKTGVMIGTEVLMRWWRPDDSKEGGVFIPPVEFIPVAEQSGLIVPIGEWALRQACAVNKMWQDKGLPPMRIAVNISGVQFHRSNIVELVATVLKETKLAPHLLELEVTESVFMENIQGTIDILNQLHRLGVEIAIDDFGTGYSSLSYLRQFPIDRLKIDQSFTRNALSNLDDRMITKTIISLGHSLGLKVVAEGVETSDHEQFLKDEGCDEVQGFKYTRPIPAEKFWDYAVEYNRNLAKNTKLAVVDSAPKK